MDPQLVLIGAGVAAAVALVIAVVRAARADADLGPVSHQWLTDRQRLRIDRS